MGRSSMQQENRPVIMLDLRGDPDQEKYLRGKISPSLMELSHLKYLDLSHNTFIGQIPHQLGNLSRLQYLNLSHSYDSSVENLKWLSHLSNLQYLDLSVIDLSELDDWLKIVSMLSKLSTLRLTMCYLSPPTLSSFLHINASTSLSTIQLNNNFLNSPIFHWLFNSSASLSFLDLSSNELNGSIPESFGKMNALTHLDLSENLLQGEIPISFGNLCKLQNLYLSRNNLRGQLAFIHNLSSCARSLQCLQMGMNHFNGPLPDFSVFPFLKLVDLADNELNGNLTKGFGDLFELEILDLSSNHLDGVISEFHLSNFSKLVVLGLSSEYLDLELNLNWVPSFQLRFLDLRSCKMGRLPNFPTWLQTQRNLYYLDISGLGISNSIPNWFSHLASDMYYLNLSNNHIHGTLPKIQALIIDLSNNKFSGPILSLCNISLFPIILDLSNNQISGVIPDHCLSSWRRLTVLNLANNNFSGKIPSFTGDFYWLETLDLQNNSFSGEIPWSMRSCTLLTFINMGDNKLSGKIPAWIGESLIALKFLILRSNKLHGSIPLHLCQLVDLQILDLSHNNIFGTIPQCFNNFTAMTRNANSSEVVNVISAAEYMISGYSIKLKAYVPFDYINKAMVLLKGRSDEYKGNLVYLRVIDLSSNQLIGNFCSGLLNLLGLVALNLSRNNLSGTLPRNIGELNQLQSLDLSHNKFSGEIPTSMSDLNFLSHLDLSYNKFSGKIPTGTQLQSFDASVYSANQALCGSPLSVNCSSGQVAPAAQSSNGTSEDEFKKWFLVGIASGFVFGFWGVCGIIFFNRSVRHAYFLFVNKLIDRVMVKLAILKARLHRR